MPTDLANRIALLGGAIVLLVAAGLLARLISRRAGWEPAGPIALIAAVPFVPYVPLISGLSLDDLLPIVGLAMLAWRSPVPRITTDTLLRVILLAVAVTILARVLSALVNGGEVAGTLSMLAKAVARPVLLVGIAGYTAMAIPEEMRRRFVALAIASVGTFEAAFGLIAFAVPLPGGVGIEAARRLTSLYGVCPGRIAGTMGLSPNHLGAVFVVTLPMTIGQAMSRTGWQRWAWTVAAVLQVVALVLTFTRSSILLGLVVPLVFLLVYRKVVMLVFMAAASIAVLFVMLSLGCAVGSGGHGLPGDPLDVVGGRFSDGNDRLALWYAAAHITLDYPIAGIGLGNMDSVLKADPERYSRTPYGTATNSAHNTILLAGAETGVAGALAAAAINIGIALVALRYAWRGWKRRDPLLVAAALAIGGFLAQGMFNNLFEVGATGVLLALVLGAFATGPGTQPNEGNPMGEAVTGRPI
ncbi:MAG: O-antigen ligase family protein [Chloroflexi bacterium]|nr:O-antigen ligase family protein [Chloroflexota bacterium]